MDDNPDLDFYLLNMAGVVSKSFKINGLREEDVIIGIDFYWSEFSPNPNNTNISMGPYTETGKCTPLKRMKDDGRGTSPLKNAVLIHEKKSTGYRTYFYTLDEYKTRF